MRLVVLVDLVALEMLTDRSVPKRMSVSAYVSLQPPITRGNCLGIGVAMVGSSRLPKRATRFTHPGISRSTPRRWATAAEKSLQLRSMTE